VAHYRRFGQTTSQRKRSTRFSFDITIWTQHQSTTSSWVMPMALAKITAM
jgi:hypothetical protein